MSTSTLGNYRRRRNFAATPEPRGSRPGGAAPLFVVQKHRARRLHWDFRLEQDGVLWSWALPKGPSMDPADKRLAVHVEDHPLDYAGFEGDIPAGNYGAGSVEIWDHGQWEPLGDPAEGLRRGELKFSLAGERLHGRFALVRLRSRGRRKGDNWLLVKERDEAAEAGGDAGRLEVTAPPAPAREPAAKEKPRKARPRAKAPTAAEGLEGAVAAPMPSDPRPQLASPSEDVPAGDRWLVEVKFDGYRLLVRVRQGAVALLTRGGQDWTDRMPGLAGLIARQALPEALLDAELVHLRPDGVSDFPLLQQALSAGDDRAMSLCFFDLLYLDGKDLRPCPLAARKAALAGLLHWNERLRYSDHHRGEAAAMRRNACKLGLEGIVCKRADAPYRAGRNADWLKVKCSGREEFVVLGRTAPAGSREGLGALHLGFYDDQGALHYAGGVGTGFSRQELTRLSRLLDGLAAPAPPPFAYAGDRPESDIAWVKPELVVEVQSIGWSGAGRLRHPVYLGQREDKRPADVVRPVPDAGQPRHDYRPRRSHPAIVRAERPGRSRTRRPAPAAPARPPEAEDFAGLRLTHPERELWPGVTKRDLARYWLAVADAALPGIAHRPLALVRAPDGIEGQRFFQKHAMPGQPKALGSGTSKGDPYLALEDQAGLVACAQIAAIELHGWGAGLDDPDHADRLVFDLDPGEGVPFAQVVASALLVRERLASQGLRSFCRTTGGKGLHVVVPLAPEHDWETVRAFGRGFAETLAAEQPGRFIVTVSKAARRGKVLVDWLRNARGATAVVSYSPRARPGAGVATPLAWREVTPGLDPAAWTLATVPGRLSRRPADPWEGFAGLAQRLPAAPRR